MEKVAVVEVAAYESARVAEGLREALSLLGGLEAFVRPGERVLIKPNMLEGTPPEKAVTTHPEVVRAMIRAVKDCGGVPAVGDSPAVASTVKTARRCGVLAVCREEGAALLPFADSAEIACPGGAVMKRFTLARPVAEADKVISLAKMKTHTFMGTTGATKNLFGCVVGMQKAQFHLRLQARREFAAMLIDLAQCVQPALSVVDGVVGMEGDGPRNGKPAPAGVLLAGANPLAVDVVMAEVMGFASGRLPLTELALKRGLTPPFADIVLAGGGGGKRLFFAEPRSLRSLDERVPGWLAAMARAQLTVRPSIAPHCSGCGRCVAHCPPRAMTLRDGKACIDDRACIRCYCCQELCPSDAVRLREKFLLRAAKRLEKLFT